MPGTTRGYTMLMIRVEEGDFEGVKAALYKYPNEKINDQNKHGQTALALAARSGNCDIGDFLILEGADVNLPNKSGQTPLFIACSYNHVDFVKLLLRHQAEVNTKDSRGWTPLMSACQNSNVALVELLLKYKADVRPIDRFGKNARQRTKDLHITNLLLEIERRIDQLEEEAATSFVTPKKKSVRAYSEDSPNKTALKESLVDIDKEDDEDESILDLYTSNLDQTLRACPQFVQDMEIYKMHKKAGYYKYLKSTDPRNLRAGSLQNLKSDRRDRSLEYLLDLNSTLRSPMTNNDLLTDRSRGRRNTLKDLKDTSKLNDTRYSCPKTIKKDRHPSKEGEGMDSPRSGRTNGTPMMGQSGDDQKMDSSLLKSIVSPAATAKPKYKSILKNSTRLEEFSSPMTYTLNVTQQEDSDEVLNEELKNLYRIFIQKLADRTQKILSDKVAKMIDQEVEHDGKISKERMDDIITAVAAELEDKTVTSFKVLVGELLDMYPLSDKLAKAVEEGTEELIKRVAVFAQEDISKLNHAINSPRLHTREEDTIEGDKTGDNKGDILEKLKTDIQGKVDELFKAMDSVLSGKGNEEKEAFVNKYGPEILETLENLKNKILNGDNVIDEGQEEVCEVIPGSHEKSKKATLKIKEVPSQHQHTSEASGNMRYLEAQNSFDLEEMPQAGLPQMARKTSRSSRSNDSPRIGENSIEMELQNTKKGENRDRDSLNGLDMDDLSTQRTREQTNDTLVAVSCNTITKQNMSPKGSEEEVCLRSHRAHSLESDINSADVVSLKPLADGLMVHNAHGLESDVDSHISSPHKVVIHKAQELESDKEGGSYASSPVKKTAEDNNAGNTLATGASSCLAKSEDSSDKLVVGVQVDTIKTNAHDLESDKSASEVSSPQKDKETTESIEVSAPIHNAQELKSDKDGDSHTSSPLKKFVDNNTTDDVVAEATNTESGSNGVSNNAPIKVDTIKANAHDLESDKSASEISSPQKTGEIIEEAKISTATHNAQELESDKDDKSDVVADSSVETKENIKIELSVHNAHNLESDVESAHSASKKGANAHELESDVDSHACSPNKVNIHNAHELESDKRGNIHTASPLQKTDNDNVIDSVLTDASVSLASSMVPIKVDFLKFNSRELESDKSASEASSPQKIEEIVEVAQTSIATHNAQDLESDKDGDSHTSSPLKKTANDNVNDVIVDEATNSHSGSNDNNSDVAVKVDTVKLNAHDLESEKSASEVSSSQKTKETVDGAQASIATHNAQDLESDKDNKSGVVAISSHKTKENLQVELSAHNAHNLESDIESAHSATKKGIAEGICLNACRAHELESDIDSSCDMCSAGLKTRQNITVEICQQKHNAEELQSDKDSACIDLVSPKENTIRHDSQKESEESQSDDLVIFGKSQKTREYDGPENSIKFTETEECDNEDLSNRKSSIQRVNTKSSEVIYDESGVFIGRKKEILKEDSLADIDMVESEMVSNYERDGTPVTHNLVTPGRRVLDKLNTLESEVLYRDDDETVLKTQEQEIVEEELDEEILRSKDVQQEEVAGKKETVSIESADNADVSAKVGNIDAATMRKALLRRHVVAQSITSFTSRARPMIPIPTPSKYVVKTVKMQIDEIPRCENFHYLGQTRKMRTKSMAVPRKVLRETVVGVEEITIVDN